MRNAFLSAICSGALVLLLAACGDPDIKRASLPLGKSTPGELFWFDRKAATLVVVMGDDPARDPSSAKAIARALAWPDRLVLALPALASSQSCAGVVDDAVKAVRGFAARAGRPVPTAPVVVGLDGAAALSFAKEAQAGVARAVVAMNYCPGMPPVNCASSGEGPSRVGMPIIAIPNTQHCTAAEVNASLGAFADARAITPAGGTIDLASTIVDQVIGTVTARVDNGNALDLPLIELPTAGKDDRLAIIYSGDGGWADIDRQLGEELSKRGVAVVGVDSLKYFWRRKDPIAAAEDLERIIAHYSAAWGKKRIVLVGYSFGADVLPFLWSNLSTASRAKVSHMALLAMSADASFEITVGGWVGVEPSEAEATGPAVKLVSGTHVFCVQAGEDTDDPCPTLDIDALKLPGDHHFDRDYKKLAGLILTRSAKP